MAWTLTLTDGQVVREDDLTIDEAVLVEEASGLTWRQINPLRSAACAKAMFVALEVQRGVQSKSEAEKVYGGMSTKALLEKVGFYDPADDLPAEYQDGFPPEADETSTPS